MGTGNAGRTAAEASGGTGQKSGSGTQNSLLPLVVQARSTWPLEAAFAVGAEGKGTKLLLSLLQGVPIFSLLGVFLLCFVVFLVFLFFFPSCMSA